MLSRTLRPISKILRSNAKYSQAAGNLHLIEGCFECFNPGLPLNEGSPAPLPSEDRTISPKILALVDEIANLSLLDVSDLNWALKKRLNIPDQPLMAAAAFAPAAAAAPVAQGTIETREI